MLYYIPILATITTRQYNDYTHHCSSHPCLVSARPTIGRTAHGALASGLFLISVIRAVQRMHCVIWHPVSFMDKSAIVFYVSVLNDERFIMFIGLWINNEFGVITKGLDYEHYAMTRSEVSLKSLHGIMSPCDVLYWWWVSNARVGVTGVTHK